MKVDRIIIYPKDVQRITGRSERYGRLLLKRIRDCFGKQAHQFVSINEFCSYTGLNIDQVSEFLQ